MSEQPDKEIRELRHELRKLIDLLEMMLLEKLEEKLDDDGRMSDMYSPFASTN
ncbi:hypothetical protein LCGC14_1744410 [marine sediment metagenome]|uniref:Uncharacterized protein n=1 Tax=marine sediment metagenome TaxID=412755 RepID=A0A0F9K5A3_9ZZZZ